MNRARRIRGVVLAGLLVASQGSAWLHAAAVAHATCLEHGETIHADAIVVDAAKSAVEPSTPGVRGDAAAAFAHEHCGGGALVRFRDLALPAPTAIAFVPTLHRSRVRDDSHGAIVAVDVYAVAPKTSPPSTGA